MQEEWIFSTNIDAKHRIFSYRKMFAEGENSPMNNVLS
jgi:hypothetical protein